MSPRVAGLFQTKKKGNPGMSVMACHYVKFKEHRLTHYSHGLSAPHTSVFTRLSVRYLFTKIILEERA